MSVWASRLVIGDTWPDQPAPPLIYGGSHVIPSHDGERGGSVDTAHLPGFLTRAGYDDASDGEDAPWWPFLRLSVRPMQARADAEDTVILDVDQVDALIADLTEWRANVGEQH